MERPGRWIFAAVIAGWATLSAAEAPAAGNLYGTVTTRSGDSYAGVLRWDDEESYWDDIFHSSKDELPYLRFEERADRRSGDWPWWQELERRIRRLFASEGSSRIFAARFGDIRSIEVAGREAARITMRDDSTHPVSGYANDVDATVTVEDATAGSVALEWKAIDTIEFAAAPADVRPPASRLYGTVTTEVGSFTGFVQWDKQECQSTDRLDGETEDGSMSIPMGSIRTIERRSKRSARVELVDGRELVLSGTNDVDSSNRGVLVEDPRHGRVEVPWQVFDRVDFLEPPGTGPGRDSYRDRGPIRGTLIDREDARVSGRIVFDLDESAVWELLDGEIAGVLYSVPFARVAAIEPAGSAAVVTLTSGELLRLDETQDTSSRNAGVVVLTGDGDTVYRPWADIRRLELDHD